MVLDYRGTEIEVEYKIVGDFYPETYETPAEYPEAEITDIQYKDVSVFSLLEFDLDYIYELLENKL